MDWESSALTTTPLLHKDSENQGSNFLGGRFSNSDDVRAPIQFRRVSQPSILKDDFSSRIYPSIFPSITPVLSDQSNETS